MAAAMTKFDDLFFGVLQSCEQIEPFLELVFSFLARRTDFFRIMHKKTDKMGFSPGVAEKMLSKIFRKYQGLVLKSEERPHKTSADSKEKKKRKETKINPKHDATPVNTTVPPSTPSNIPPVVSSVDVETSNTVDSSQHIDQPLHDTSIGTVQKPTQSLLEATTSSENAQPAKSEVAKPSTAPDCFNGGVLENYMWSQTGSEIDIRVPVSNTVKGKDVLVDIKNNYLKVALRNAKEGPNVLLQGELQWRVHAEESVWTLIPGEHVHISMDKVEDRWWTCVIKGDEEIDKSKIDTTRDISEFDEQTQCDYEKVMYDQRQKMMGKPTSDEMKTHEMLKKAWDAPNSPFAGTPFDPSKVNISGNSNFV